MTYWRLSEKYSRERTFQRIYPFRKSLGSPRFIPYQWVIFAKIFPCNLAMWRTKRTLNTHSMCNGMHICMYIWNPKMYCHSIQCNAMHEHMKIQNKFKKCTQKVYMKLYGEKKNNMKIKPFNRFSSLCRDMPKTFHAINKFANLIYSKSLSRCQYTRK